MIEKVIGDCAKPTKLILQREEKLKKIKENDEK